MLVYNIMILMYIIKRERASIIIKNHIMELKKKTKFCCIKKVMLHKIHTQINRHILLQCTRGSIFSMLYICTICVFLIVVLCVRLMLKLHTSFFYKFIYTDVIVPGSFLYYYIVFACYLRRALFFIYSLS